MNTFKNRSDNSLNRTILREKIANGNGSYGTEERQRYNGTVARHGTENGNGETATAERQRNGGNQADLHVGNRSLL